MTEIDIEGQIYKWLETKEIFPFSVLVTFCTNDSGLLSITFFFQRDLESFLNELGYKKRVDKSGYTVLEDTLTVILTDAPLTKLYTLL